MWFKYGLKAQKLLAQGIALGIMTISKAPCKGKSFVYCQVFESFCPYRATGWRTIKGLRQVVRDGTAWIICRKESTRLR